jgi:hypothetical protein
LSRLEGTAVGRSGFSITASHRVDRKEIVEVVNENANELDPWGSSEKSDLPQSPLAAKRKAMFADLIIEGTRHPGRCVPDSALSLGAHVLLIVALLIRPLFF